MSRDWTELDDDVFDEFSDARMEHDLVAYIDRWLSEKRNPDSYWPNVGSLLSKVCFSQDVEAAKRLLDAGADPDGAVPKGDAQAPLVTASFKDKRREELLGVLLGAGADVNCTQGRYGSALAEVLWKGDEASLIMLLEMGADPKFGGLDGDGLPNVRVPDSLADDAQQRVIQIFKDYGHQLPPSKPA